VPFEAPVQVHPPGGSRSAVCGVVVPTHVEAGDVEHRCKEVEVGKLEVAA